MPNWCHNKFSVVGSVRDINQFEQDMKDDIVRYCGQNVPIPTFTINCASPMPEELVGTRSPRKNTTSEIAELAKINNWTSLQLSDMMKNALTLEEESSCNALVAKYGVDNWYEWCCIYWGTKWDACHSENNTPQRSPGQIIYDFDTAWCPPHIAIHAFANKYKTLKFSLACSFEEDLFQEENNIIGDKDIYLDVLAKSIKEHADKKNLFDQELA